MNRMRHLEGTLVSEFAEQHFAGRSTAIFIAESLVSRQQFEACRNTNKSKTMSKKILSLTNPGGIPDVQEAGRFSAEP